MRVNGFLMAGWMATLLLPATPVWAHAEHGMGEPVPQVLSTKPLPKGVDLLVVKTTAHQFSLSSDGQQRIDVLGEDGEAFLRIDKDQVLANANSAWWYRAQQPGGGPVPERLKAGDRYIKQEAAWMPIAAQSGFGWYDARLVDAQRSRFTLTLRVNGTDHAVHIERKAAPAFSGYWTSRLTAEPDTIGLSALIPGLSTGTIALTRDPEDAKTVDILDSKGQAFIRSTQQGWWVNTTHVWFKQLGLFVNIPPQALSGTGESLWVKASDARMLTYQDPRLQAPSAARTGSSGGAANAAKQWRIPVRIQGHPQTLHFAGEMQWKAVGTRPH